MDFQNKNILIILHQGSLGGAERQGLGISKILTEKYGCSVYLLLTFSSDKTQEFRDYEKDCKIVQTFHFGYPHLEFRNQLTIKNFKKLKWSVEYLLKLRKGLKPYNFEILLPFLNFPSKISYYLYRMLPSVKTTFWHQLGLDVLTYDYFEKIAINNIPFVVSNSSNGLDMFREDYKIDPRKLNILPQYVSLEFQDLEKMEMREKFGISEGKLVIGMIAHFRPEKLHNLLLNAFKELSDKNPNLVLCLVGNKNNTSVTNDKFNYIGQIIEESGLSSKVRLLSGVKVQEILSIMDIGVLVSDIEGMPNSVMEYMLYGLPVVATNHPGCKYLLGNSEFLISNKKDELVKSLGRLILDEQLREKEGLKNKALIKNYDMESYVSKLSDIMDKYSN